MSPLQLIIYTAVLSGLVALAVYVWRNIKQPVLGKTLLFVSIILAFFGLPLVIWGNPEVGGALLAVASVCTGVESYIRNKKTDTPSA